MINANSGLQTTRDKFLHGHLSVYHFISHSVCRYTCTTYKYKYYWDGQFESLWHNKLQENCAQIHVAFLSFLSFLETETFSEFIGDRNIFVIPSRRIQRPTNRTRRNTFRFLLFCSHFIEI